MIARFWSKIEPLRGFWWLAAIGWFVLVTAGWSGWFAWRAAQVEKAQREAEVAYRAQVEALNAAPVPAGGATASPPDAEQLMRDVGALSFERHHDADRSRARKYIAHALRAVGWRAEVQSFAKGINLVALREGRLPERGEVVLGAHYDTVAGTPGADDNATGVAVVLAAARRWSKGPRPERSLRLVFFDGEERGLLGSRAYAADPSRMDPVFAAVIVEMVGFSCAAPGCQRSPEGVPPGLVPTTGTFLGVVGDLEHVALLSTFRRAGGPGRPEVRVLPVPGKGLGMPDTRRSDHAPFWDAGVGAVMVTDTADLRSAHYHQPSDTPETLNPVFLQGAAAVVLDAVAELLGPVGEEDSATTTPPGSPRPEAAPPPRSTP